MPDGPEKTILGSEQKAWLMKTLSESKATFKLVFSPTPIVGPDRKNKRDNHANTGLADSCRDGRCHQSQCCVLIVDKIPRISECPLGFSDHVELCPLHKLLDEASRLVEDAFGGATIADLIPERKQSQSCDFPNGNKTD